MKQLMLVAVAVLVASCASTDYQPKAPATTNLTAFVNGLALLEDAKGCHVVIAFETGRSARVALDRGVCRDAATAAVIKAKAAQAAAQEQAQK